tara:strand:- start:2653 stop:3411 length:759 start_codon:yes stop_codon:yes gene_type:complete
MEIEFSAHKDYYKLKDNFPTPIKFNIPEWYKKLPHGTKSHKHIFNRTIKGCMPFMETLTNGYLLKTPVDYHIRHGTQKDKNGKPITIVMTALEMSNERYFDTKGLNIDMADPHPINQLEGSPQVEKNGRLPFPKISNPWHIKTPKGYSCLFTDPLNNKQQDFFSIISGIVHTDEHPLEVNFPIVINHEKYGHTDLTIARGTPYVQIIPFKRDDWKMKVTPKETEKVLGKIWNLSFLNNYKNKIFNKNKTKWT